jgi:TRAP-type C4-dicarboxylate transport system substrate-binding protein
VNNAWVFSRTAYDRLPAEYKKLLEDERADFYKVAKEAYRAADQHNIPMFDKAGLERITFTPELLAPFQSQAGKPVWDKWVKETAGKGLPAQEALDLILKTAKQTTAK